jgi:S-DNA-T family DNA segregation ATPase FtsK/SpoIIIE
MAAKKSSKTVKKSPKTTPEVRGLLCLSASLVIFISLVSFAQGNVRQNWLGILGLSMGFLLHSALGLSSYILCGFLGWIGWRLLFNKPLNQLLLKSSYMIVLIISTSMLLSILEVAEPSLFDALSGVFYPVLKERHFNYHLGGAPAFYIYRDLPYVNLERLLNWLGALCLFASAWLASLLFLTRVSPWKIAMALKGKWRDFRDLLNPIRMESIKETFKGASNESEMMRYVKLRNSSAIAADEIAIQPESEIKARPTVSKKSIRQTALIAAPPLSEVCEPLSQCTDDYKLPPPSLLTNARKTDQSHLKSHLKRQAEVLEETLLSFGIEAKVGQINCGPTITSFEVHPAVGVKVQKIKTLENDIALNMEAKSIRIIAPIPGKAAVGIEVPNPQPQEVGFKEMLSAYQQGAQKLKIPLLLGKAVNGDYVISDLAKWPHCLIAGATGSGKSVCINTIVMSILLNARPDEIKLLMIDPKKVELTAYGALPHMLAPVICEPRDACNALNWLVREMEKRYEILKLTGARNIEAFNARTIKEDLESALEAEIPKKLPYIVGIIDELADLMMVASGDIETPIARIAQMARAVGIHLILATQRPSREVITGLIKANFPTRISFKVASRINSQIILDEIGAEALLGNGDMLFLPPGSSHLIRAQGAYIRDEDIAAAIAFICKQMPVQYMIQSFKPSALSLEEESDENEDPLYQQALDTVLSTGNASTTFLQRKLKLGYARAASLMDKLEARGVVGPADGAKPRKILVGRSANKQADDLDLFDGEEE